MALRAACILLLLVGCSGDTASLPVNPSLTAQALAQLRGAGGTRPAPADLRAAMTPEFVAALPAPTLFAVLNGAVSLPERIATSEGVETWLTEDGITLSTRGGLIVATRGLGFDIMESDVAEALAAILGGAGRASRSHAWLDGDEQLQRRSFDCAYTHLGPQVTEQCYALGLAFENRYSLAAGRIVASRQWLGPVQGAITLERLND